MGLFHGGAVLQGEVVLSRMTGGTVSVPRCGPVDTKLTMQFVLQLPPHDTAEITVASKVKQRAEGQYLLFDESMEHTVSAFTPSPPPPPPPRPPVHSFPTGIHTGM